MKRIIAEVEEDFHDQIKHQAIDEHLSVKAIVVKAIQEYLAKRKKRAK